MIDEDQATQFVAQWLYWGIKGIGICLVGISPFIAASYVSALVERWLDDPCRRARFSGSKDFIAGASFFVALAAAFAAFPLAGLAARHLRLWH